VKEAIIAFIMEQFKRKEIITFRIVLEFIESNFRLSMFLDTLRKIIKSTQKFQSITGIPMEAERVRFLVTKLSTILSNLKLILLEFRERSRIDL
jgi:hypothetical protein